MPSQYRIIAVCTGNICRSPMAELMLAEAFRAERLTRAVVDSAGTTAYEAGRPMDPRAARKLTSQNIASDGHVAREWRPEWFVSRELILALDVDHYGWLRQAAPDRESLAKIRMLRSFDPRWRTRTRWSRASRTLGTAATPTSTPPGTSSGLSVPGIVEHVRTELQRRDGDHHGSDQPNAQQRVRSIS